MPKFFLLGADSKQPLGINSQGLSSNFLLLLMLIHRLVLYVQTERGIGG